MLVHVSYNSSNIHGEQDGNSVDDGTARKIIMLHFNQWYNNFDTFLINVCHIGSTVTKDILYRILSYKLLHQLQPDYQLIVYLDEVDTRIHV